MGWRKRVSCLPALSTQGCSSSQREVHAKHGGIEVQGFRHTVSNAAEGQSLSVTSQKCCCATVSE